MHRLFGPVCFFVHIELQSRPLFKEFVRAEKTGKKLKTEKVRIGTGRS
jgi:hypothetical protein